VPSARIAVERVPAPGPVKQTVQTYPPDIPEKIFVTRLQTAWPETP